MQSTDETKSETTLFIDFVVELTIIALFISLPLTMKEHTVSNVCPFHIIKPFSFRIACLKFYF